MYIKDKGSVEIPRINRPSWSIIASMNEISLVLSATDSELSSCAEMTGLN